MQTIVVLTGAGISAESGIRTFRDSDGLWEEYRIEDVATYDAWRRNPDLVLEFYNQRRRQLATVKPNAAHFALVRCLDAHLGRHHYLRRHRERQLAPIHHQHGLHRRRRL